MTQALVRRKTRRKRCKRERSAVRRVCIKFGVQRILPPRPLSVSVKLLVASGVGHLLKQTFCREKVTLPHAGAPCQIMGILNVTPDSFSDGGNFLSTDAAVAHAIRMFNAGATIIDVGGESTRPGAQAVTVQEELDRVIPVILALRSVLPILISIDTSKPEVMREAVYAGAGMINDVRALRAEGAMQVVRELDVPVCLMHMQGEPGTMQQVPHYGDVVAEVRDFLLERVRVCESHGISRESLLIDPGFGFGKALKHNLRLLAELETLVEIGIPVLVGLSRKSMIGSILHKPVDERLFGSIAVAVIAACKGASLLRVHDVAQTIDALKMVQAVRGAMKKVE